jgi:thiamine biosynthesis lipoprotein
VDHGLGSVTVVHESCATADALATALYVLGADAGIAWAESKGIAALFLTPKGEGMDRRASSAYEDLLQPAAAAAP